MGDSDGTYILITTTRLLADNLQKRLKSKESWALTRWPLDDSKQTSFYEHS